MPGLLKLHNSLHTSITSSRNGNYFDLSGEFLERVIYGTMTAGKSIAPHRASPLASIDVCRDFLFGKCRSGLLFDVLEAIVRTTPLQRQ